MLVTQLWQEERFPLEELLDAPGRVLQCLVGLRWHRRIETEERRRRQAFADDMQSAAAMHHVLRGGN